LLIAMNSLGAEHQNHVADCHEFNRCEASKPCC
jgi:hypothetical protein